MQNLETYFAKDPAVQQKARNWMMAIGLRDADSLAPSDLIWSIARQDIEGKATQIPGMTKGDKITLRTAEILQSDTFGHGPFYLVMIHKSLFKDIYDHAGTVQATAKKRLSEVFAQEEKFSYMELTISDTVVHITKFISELWSVQPFTKGNTRAVAIFAIQYLKNMGLKVANEIFGRKSKYFQSALALSANDSSHLELFFRNLLMGEHNTLDEKHLLILLKNPPKIDPNERRPRGYTRQLILSEIKKHPYTTRERLADIAGISPDGIKKHLEKLKSDGIIQHFGSTKRGYYKITGRLHS